MREDFLICQQSWHIQMLIVDFLIPLFLNCVHPGLVRSGLWPYHCENVHFCYADDSLRQTGPTLQCWTFSWEDKTFCNVFNPCQQRSLFYHSWSLCIFIWVCRQGWWCKTPTGLHTFPTSLEKNYSCCWRTNPMCNHVSCVRLPKVKCCDAESKCCNFHMLFTDISGVKFSIHTTTTSTSKTTAGQTHLSLQPLRTRPSNHGSLGPNGGNWHWMKMGWKQP